MESALQDMFPVPDKDGLIHPPHHDVGIQEAKALLGRVVRGVKGDLYGVKRSRWRCP